jgi:hypothetical protein
MNPTTATPWPPGGARPHPDRPAVPHAPAGAGRAAVRRAPRPRAPRRRCCSGSRRCCGACAVKPRPRTLRRDRRGRPPADAPRGGGWTGGVDARGHRAVQHMIRLHPRYVEGFTPAVAAMLGIGLAWAADVGKRTAPRCAWRSSWRRSRSSSTTPSACCTGGPRSGGSRSPERSARSRARCSHACPDPLENPLAAGAAGVIALALVAVLAIPLRADFTAIADRVSDAGLVGELPGAQQHPLSAYLLAHQDGARYEVAAESATAVGSLIVQDARPIVVLTTYDARVFTSIAKLKRLIAKGEVRYAFLNTFCTGVAQALNPACSEPARWVRAHGTDVSLQAGLPQGACCTCCPGRRRERQPRKERSLNETSLDVLADARAAGRIALDTEFMGEGRYRTLLCLIQLAIPDGRGRASASSSRPARRGPRRRTAGGHPRRPGGPGRRARRAPGHRARAQALRHRGAQRIRHAGRGRASRGWARSPPMTRCSPRSSACAWPRARASRAGTRARSHPSSSPTRARTSCTCSSWRRSWSAACPRSAAWSGRARSASRSSAPATSATPTRSSRACRASAA